MENNKVKYDIPVIDSVLSMINDVVTDTKAHNCSIETLCVLMNINNTLRNHAELFSEPPDESAEEIDEVILDGNN